MAAAAAEARDAAECCLIGKGLGLLDLQPRLLQLRVGEGLPLALLAAGLRSAGPERANLGCCTTKR